MPHSAPLAQARAGSVLTTGSAAAAATAAAPPMNSRLEMPAIFLAPFPSSDPYFDTTPTPPSTSTWPLALAAGMRPELTLRGGGDLGAPTVALHPVRGLSASAW